MPSKLKFILIMVAAISLIFFVWPHPRGTSQLVISTPTPGPRPKVFKYDAATDLKQELEKINPQIYDSDFEER